MSQQALKYGSISDIQAAIDSGALTLLSQNTNMTYPVSDQAIDKITQARADFCNRERPIDLPTFKTIFASAVKKILKGTKPSSNRYLDRKMLVKCSGSSQELETFIYPKSGSVEVVMLETMLMLLPYSRLVSRNDFEMAKEIFDRIHLKEGVAVFIEGPLNYRVNGSNRGRDLSPELLTAIDNRPAKVEGRPWFNYIVLGPEEFVESFSQHYKAEE